MRILICGGRYFNNYALICDVMDEIFPHAMDDDSWLPPAHTVIIHGGGPGADACADRWGVNNFLKVECFPADWDRFGPAAGPLRNQRMIDEGKPDLVIAFPGGRGTADMIRRAKAAGIPVKEIS